MTEEQKSKIRNIYKSLLKDLTGEEMWELKYMMDNKSLNAELIGEICDDEEERDGA